MKIVFVQISNDVPATIVANIRQGILAQLGPGFNVVILRPGVEFKALV